MDIETLATLDALIEVIDPTSSDEQNTYLGFAVKKCDVEALIADIETLVREKYRGCTYAELLDGPKDAMYRASRIALFNFLDNIR